MKRRLQNRALEVLEKLEPGCRAYFAGGSWDSADFDAAAAEYCRLFILPGSPAPSDELRHVA